MTRPPTIPYLAAETRARVKARAAGWPGWKPFKDRPEPVERTVPSLGGYRRPVTLPVVLAAEVEVDEMAPMKRDEMAGFLRRIDRKLDRVLKELRALRPDAAAENEEEERDGGDEGQGEGEAGAARVQGGDAA